MEVAELAAAHPGGDRVVAHRQHPRLDPEGARLRRCDLGQRSPGAPAGGAPDVGPEVAIAELEPGLLAEAVEHRERLPALVTKPPPPLLVVDVGQQDGELVAAEARDDVLGAQHVPQAAGDGLQQLVADAVAEGVVDDLEVVEVEEETGQPVAAGAESGRALSASRCVRTMTLTS